MEELLKSSQIQRGRTIRKTLVSTRFAFVEWRQVKVDRISPRRGRSSHREGATVSKSKSSEEPTKRPRITFDPDSDVERRAVYIAAAMLDMSHNELLNKMVREHLAEYCVMAKKAIAAEAGK